jgi:error-prone DNA polymerase
VLLKPVGQRLEAAEELPGQGAAAEQGGPVARKARDIAIPDLRLGSGIRVPTRDFR